MVARILPTLAALWACSVVQPILAQEDYQCFFPNGDPDPKSSPCNTTAVDAGGNSGCCIRNDPCFTDGTCATFDTNIPYRGSCTDESWTDGACPRDLCMDTTQIGQVSWIIKCYPRNDTSCCLLGEETCCFGDEFFTYEPGPMIALLDGDGNNVLAEGTASGGSTATKTVMATTTITPSSGASSGITSSDETKDNGTEPAIIGLAVALGVSVLALGLAVGLLWGKLQSERKLRAENAAAASSATYQGTVVGSSTGGAPSTVAASSPPMQQHMAYKPPEEASIVPPMQPMSPQQLYTPTPVELHGYEPPRSEMWDQNQPLQPYRPQH